MYKTVIFDLDGTLLDTLGDLTDACNAVCIQNGWPTHTEGEIRQMVGNGNPKLVERFAPPEQRTPERMAAALSAFMAHYNVHKTDRTAPYPGVMEMLSALRRAGLRLAVLSNKADALCEPIVRHYFGETFDAVCGKREGVSAKPDPAGALALLARLNADAAETLYVGDSDVDVATGHNAGLAVCGVTWGFRSREELFLAGAEFLADDAAELMGLVLG